jgi:hypothetical protein
VELEINCRRVGEFFTSGISNRRAIGKEFTQEQRLASTDLFCGAFDPRANAKDLPHRVYQPVVDAQRLGHRLARISFRPVRPPNQACAALLSLVSWQIGPVPASARPSFTSSNLAFSWLVFASLPE